MGLPTDQLLQQGIAAHQEGKLEEAERLYREVLQSEPKNPDANHNLGVIALSSNQGSVALALFRTALDANPKVEQFWLSFIGALIKEREFENARKVIEQGKEQGAGSARSACCYCCFMLLLLLFFSVFLNFRSSPAAGSSF